MGPSLELTPHAFPQLLDIMLQILVDGPCKSENLFLENKKSCKKSLSRNEELEYF